MAEHNQVEILLIEDSCEKIGESHFYSTHTFPTDEIKQVELHHIFYDLHTE